MSVSHLNDGSNPYADFISEDPEDLLVDLESDLEEAIGAYQSSDQLNPMLTPQAQQLELNTIGQMLGQLDADTFSSATKQEQNNGVEAKLTAMANGEDLSTLNAIAEGNIAQGIAANEPGSHLPLQAPVGLDALAASQEQIDLAKLLNPASVASTGGPYWGAELPWKRDQRSGKNTDKPSSEDDGDGGDPSNRTRKRQEAWRKYQETALERRLNGQDVDPSGS